MRTCRACGKKFPVLYPDLWAYRYGMLWYCSWSCLRKDEKEMANMVKNTGRIKKDGTPAKKPGPKPKFITDPDVEAKLPEPVSVGEWEEIDVPELPERTTDFENWPKIEYKVTGIDTAIGMFQYFKKHGYLDWTDPNGTNVSMKLEEWKEFLKVLPDALKVLGVEL